MEFFQKIYIHFSLFIKGIYNLLILIILLISSRNIKILKRYQQLYLIISIIIWILIVIIYFTKLAVIIILNILKAKLHCEKIIKIILLLSWLITNISAYIIMAIAFLYDICQIFNGNLSFIIYEFIFSTICIIFICFSINDYYHLQIIFNLICEKIRIKKEEEAKQITESKINDPDEFEFDIKELGKKMFDSAYQTNNKKQKAL